MAINDPGTDELQPPSVVRDLAEQVAIVTGAGSAAGIGFAVAEHLAARGAMVVIGSTTDRIHDRVGELVDRGFEALGFIGDLVDPNVPLRLMELVADRIGRLDILVNNAGMTATSAPAAPDTVPHGAPVDLVTDAMWHTALDRNLTTAFNMSRAAAPHMREAGYGRIVNVASVSGPVMAYTGDVGYHAAKAGLVGLTRSMALELAPHGVCVNAVAPGWIDTASSTPAELAAAGLTPVGRAGRPHEVAAVVGMLASPSASYLCGQLIVIDGGNGLDEDRRNRQPQAS